MAFVSILKCLCTHISLIYLYFRSCYGKSIHILKYYNMLYHSLCMKYVINNNYTIINYVSVKWFNITLQNSTFRCENQMNFYCLLPVAVMDKNDLSFKFYVSFSNINRHSQFCPFETCLIDAHRESIAYHWALRWYRKIDMNMPQICISSIEWMLINVFK